MSASRPVSTLECEADLVSKLKMLPVITWLNMSIAAYIAHINNTMNPIKPHVNIVNAKIFATMLFSYMSPVCAYVNLLSEIYTCGEKH